MLRVRFLAWLSRVGRDPDRELREFKQEFERASREKDREVLNRLVHPDFSMVTPEGDTVSKRDVIQGIVAPGSDFMPYFDREERTITFSKGRDLVREIADVSIAGHIPGRGDLAGQYTHSAVFIRGDKGWQFLGNTLTRNNRDARRATIPVTERPEMVAAPQT